MKRRHFLQGLGSMAVLSGAGQAATPKKTGFRCISGPFLQVDSGTSMTLSWKMNKQSTAWVEYGETETLGKKAVNATHGLIDAGGENYKVTLRNLTPGKPYYYRIVGKSITDFHPYQYKFGEEYASELLTFCLPATDAESVSWVVVNDVHDLKGTWNDLTTLAHQQPFDVAFLNGDILNSVREERQLWRSALEPARVLATPEKPFAYIRGNHDARGIAARVMPECVGMPEGRYYYSFDYGPVHFIVLDVGEDKPDHHEEYHGLVQFRPYLEEETAWLKKEVASEAYQRAAFRVVLMHIPLSQFPPALGKTWTDLLNAKPIDLMINGHMHRPNLLPPNDRYAFPVLIGGGPRENATLIRAQATRERLTATLVGRKGEMLHQWQADRS